MRKFVKQSLKKPKVTKATKIKANTRYIPKSVKHEVRVRDKNQCTYVSESGKQCSCNTALQFDHIVPYCRGGMNSAENLRLRCPAHNRLEAENMFLIPKKDQSERALIL